MTKKIKETTSENIPAHDEVTSFESEEYTTRERPQRRKVYERPAESDIPRDVIEYFAKDNYDVRMVRWAIKGEPDYRYLNRREQEGYEFVRKEELPESYIRTMRIRDTQVAKGLVTNGGDLCLMKVDKDLRKSRVKYFEGVAQDMLNAVDVNVIEKKGMLRNLGSRSKVILREPTFQD